MDLKTKYIAIVLLSALIVAFESVSVEGALNTAKIDIFLVTTVPVIVGGLIVIGFTPKGSATFVKSLDRRGWLGMLSIGFFTAVGAFLWFDAVGRIGASKEAILGGGSSEVLFIVVLSAAFLRERLNMREVLGSFLVLVGVFVVLANSETLSLTIGFGETEAILSSLLLGIAVVISAALLKTYKLTPLSGLELLLGGLILTGMGMAFGFIPKPNLNELLILLGLGVYPAMGLVTYNAGLPKIGASLTSVLFALTGVMTVGVQLAVLAAVPDANIQLPQSLGLALLGSTIAFAGVYLLNMKRKYEQTSK